MKERVKRGLSRSWFVSEDEWIKGTAGELASHQGKFKNLFNKNDKIGIRCCGLSDR